MVRSLAISKSLLLFSLLLSLLSPPLASAFSQGDDPPVLSDDLTSLLPARIDLMAVCSSLDGLDGQLAYLLKDPADSEAEVPSLAEMLADELQDYGPHIAQDRPVALVTALPEFGMTTQPYLTVIAPWNGDEFDPAEAAETTGFAVVARLGDYVAFSQDPEYSRAETVPEVALDFPLKLATIRLDLAEVVAAMRPMVEMGLGAMVASAGQTAVDEPDDGESPQGPQAMMASMTVEEATALVDLIRALMDSADRLELSLDNVADELIVGSALAVVPDSPLSPEPQPPFSEALELTRLIPGGEDILQVSAVSKFKQYDLFMEFYRLNAAREMANMDLAGADDFAAWYNRYLDMVQMFFKPMAAGVRMGDQGIAGEMAFKTTAAAGDLNRFTGMMDTYPDLGMGIEILPVPTDPVGRLPVRAWKIEIDEANLEEMIGDTPGSDLEELSRFLQKIVPNIFFCAKDDYLLGSFGHDTTKLADMVKATDRRRAAVDPRVVRAAAKAGEDCQMVVVGDLRALLNWIAEITEEISPEAKQLPWSDGVSLPFIKTLVIGDTVYDLEFRTPEGAARSLVRAIRNWEK